MHVDDTGPSSIFYLDPLDERSIVFEGVEARRGEKEGFIIVLPNESVKAFRSPTDFKLFTSLKRQGSVIIFVIPKQGVAQWAKANNFMVYSSLEELIQASQKRTKAPITSHRLVTDSDSSAVSKESEGHQSGSYFQAQIGNPVTPIPDVNEAFLYLQSAQQPSSLENEELSPAATSVPTSSPEPIKAPPSMKEKTHSARPSLVIILIFVLVIATLSGVLVFTQKSTPTATTPTLVGHVYFLSSGQIDTLGNVGINDEIEVQLSHIPRSQQGKSYYVWLRSDANRSDGPVILLGQLAVDAQGNAHLANDSPLHAYIDSQHANLLTSMSQILITQEDATIQPTVPSLDHAVWLYSGLISQMANPQDTQKHFSLLDHLRHLLAAEPSLEQLGLHGGLSLWLYRNVQKLNEYATAARDEQNAGLQHRQIIRILDYIDGVKDVSMDIPAQPNATDPNQGRVLVDPTLAGVGLLQTHANQDPASILHQIGFHLTSLVNSPGANKEQQNIAAQLAIAINNIQHWLDQMRQDAQQLVVLPNDQLQQPKARTLLNDLVIQGANALNGFTDPATNTTQNGVNWTHNTMQNLAMIDVTTFQG